MGKPIGKKKPSDNSARSIKKVQFSPLNKNNISTTSSPKKQKIFIESLLLDFEALCSKHEYAAKTFRSHPPLEAYKSLVILEYKEVANA